MQARAVCESICRSPFSDHFLMNLGGGVSQSSHSLLTELTSFNVLKSLPYISSSRIKVLFCVFYLETLTSLGVQ